MGFRYPEGFGAVDLTDSGNMGVILVDSSEIANFITGPTTVSATGGTHTYMNHTYDSSLSGVTLSPGTLVRIISQSGTAAPYIVLVKVI